MNILLKFLIAMLFTIVLPAVSFAMPMFTITPNTSALNLPRNGSGVATFTVTNSIGVDISANITYTANIAENSPFQSNVAASSTCGASLMKGQSCQLAINVQAGSVDGSGFLLPRVCYHNNCSSTVEGPGNTLVTVSNMQLFTFTTCGATGANGPSMAQCNAAYANTPLAGKVTISGSGIQQWTVPATGTYRIEAFGAQGGIGTSGNDNNVGGLGADMRGDFTLTAGLVLDIVVGQMGTTTTANGGGGGSSFVVISTGPTPILVAGGGGGLREDAAVNGFNASTSTTGVTGVADSADGSIPPGFPCPGGTNGGGGSVCSSWGAGGGGFIGNGENDEGTGGMSFLNGAVGGSGPAFGGFGGGGSGVGSAGGGGGGGYSGGGGGYVAGGGGSFNNGANQLNTAGVQSGDGKVTITFVK